MTDPPRPGHLHDVAAPSLATSSLDLETLYAHHHDGVRRTLGCLGVPAAQVDDALQEVFVVVHRHLHGTGDGTALAQFHSVKGWIYGIARRVAWRVHRTRTRAERKLALVAPARDEHDQESELARREAVDFMHAFLAELDAEQREVFVLAEIEALTAPEIAVIVGAKPNTVYSRLRLARARFELALQRRHARMRREVNHGT